MKNKTCFWAKILTPARNFFGNFVARLKRVVGKKDKPQDSKTQTSQPQMTPRQHNGSIFVDILLLLLQIACMIFAIWILWNILVLALEIIIVGFLAVVGVILNFITGLAVPDLPQMIPNFYHVCDWAISFADAMFAHAIKTFCVIFEDGIPSMGEYLDKFDSAPFKETASQFWKELLNWAASL